MVDAVDKAKRPVAMVPEMVLAILDGSKTQTRRPVRTERNPEPGNSWHRCICREIDPSDTPCDVCLARFDAAPLGYPGDLLWVRERARVVTMTIGQVILRYEADGEISEWIDYPARLKSPTVGHCIANGCFREASRVTLEVTAVRVERLSRITKADAIAEGARELECVDGPRWANGTPVGGTWSMCRPHPAEVDTVNGGDRCMCTARGAFAQMWGACYGAGSWDANPWVWVTEFRRLGSEVHGGE